MCRAAAPGSRALYSSEPERRKLVGKLQPPLLQLLSGPNRFSSDILPRMVYLPFTLSWYFCWSLTQTHITEVRVTMPFSGGGCCTCPFTIKMEQERAKRCPEVPRGILLCSYSATTAPTLPEAQWQFPCPLPNFPFLHTRGPKCSVPTFCLLLSFLKTSI